ncbi:hypothetical protein DSY14_11760 [Nocardiopsis sp. MG754419]|nr:hypothetical protein [Nocardiopsis sp. MG754419]
MGVRSTTVTVSATLLLCGALTSCAASGPTVQEIEATDAELARAADALSASLVRPGAERAFARNGHPVEGTLTCTSPAAPAEPDETGPSSTAPSAEESDTVTADGENAEGDEEVLAGSLEVVCSGQDRDGATLRFEGRPSAEALAARDEGEDGLPGRFTGSVDGEELFAMDCIRCEPQDPESPEATEPDELAGDDAASPADTE